MLLVRHMKGTGPVAHLECPQRRMRGIFSKTNNHFRHRGNESGHLKRMRSLRGLTELIFARRELLSNQGQVYWRTGRHAQTSVLPF